MFPIGNMDRLTSPTDLGRTIRDTRRRAGLRQQELAGVAGVGVRFVIEVEAGKPTAQIGKVMQLLSALGLSLMVGEDLGP